MPETNPSPHGPMRPRRRPYKGETLFPMSDTGAAAKAPPRPSARPVETAMGGGEPMPEVLGIIGRMSWTFAKTYATRCPHEWSAAKDAPDAFNELAAAIRAHGVVERWVGKPSRYLYPGDGWRYWHMGHVINRNTLEETARLRGIGLIT